jgi:hypothetical protein
MGKELVIPVKKLENCSSIFSQGAAIWGCRSGEVQMVLFLFGPIYDPTMAERMYDLQADDLLPSADRLKFNRFG